MPLQLPKIPKALLETPLLAYSRARSAGFAFEHLLLNRLLSLLPGSENHHSDFSREMIPLLRDSLQDLLKKDIAQISEGALPLRVLEPESAIQTRAQTPAPAARRPVPRTPPRQGSHD